MSRQTRKIDIPLVVRRINVPADEVTPEQHFRYVCVLPGTKLKYSVTSKRQILPGLARAILAYRGNLARDLF